MRNILCFFILLFFQSVLFAQIQEAKLFFKDEDVLKGYGMITKDNKIKFRIDLEDEPDTFDELIVKEIVFYNLGESVKYKFIKIKKEGEAELLEVLSNGYTNLLSKNIEYSSSIWNNNFNGANNNILNLYQKKNTKKVLYLKREHEDVATKVGFNFRKTAIKYFKDCEIIQELLKSKEYLSYSKKEIVDQYNVFCIE